MAVIVRRLPAGGAIFLTSLIAGDNLGAAAAAALATSPDFDLPANIAGMLTAGAFTAIHQGRGLQWLLNGNPPVAADGKDSALSWNASMPSFVRLPDRL